MNTVDLWAAICQLHPDFYSYENKNDTLIFHEKSPTGVFKSWLLEDFHTRSRTRELMDQLLLIELTKSEVNL